MCFQKQGQVGSKLPARPCSRGRIPPNWALPLPAGPRAAWAFLEFLRAPDQPGEKLYVQDRTTPPTYDDDALWASFMEAAQYPFIQRITESARQTGSEQDHILPEPPGWFLLVKQALASFS